MRAPEVKAFVDILEARVETLEKRNEELSKKHDKLEDDQKRTLQLFNDSRRELEKENLLLKQEIESFSSWREQQKKDRDEKDRRLWAFGPNIAGAIVTAVLSIIISLTTILIVTYFKTPTP